MRLLHLRSTDDGDGVSLVEFIGSNVPPYAILSHTWDSDDEVTFMDMVNGTGKEKAGYRKIHFCRHQAVQDNLDYFWMDTCCIDKTSSTELSEAINSMFHWYQNAAKCYVYLSDVQDIISGEKDDYPRRWKPQFRTSRWFTRGWTLQELIAPKIINFFSQEGTLLGSKQSLEQTLHEITGIALEALRGGPLSLFSVEERLSWAMKRKTTRDEDLAYCLLGIFDIHMPLLYGEGREKAWKRLRKEIRDDELFASQNLSPRHMEFAQLQKETMPGRSVPEIENTSHHEKKTKPEVSATAENSRRVHRTKLEKMNFLSEFEIQQPISEVESPRTMSPDALYPYSLTEPGFRVFILDSGVMGTQITGRLQEFSLLDVPAYSSLSYVWGHEPAVHRMSVNGEAIFVRPNLFHALQRIRPRTGILRIWVDSLCINQIDDSERSAQVRQMAAIFSRASSVLIWLGEKDLTSKFAMEFIPEIIGNQDIWNGSWWEHPGCIALAQLLGRPWFRRGWVLQEAAFSTNSTIHCGDSQVHMDHFAIAVDSVRARFSDIPPLIHAGAMKHIDNLANFQNSPAVKLLNTIQDVFRKSVDGQIIHRRMSLETLVDFGQFSETSDHRDAIYALLNLANDTVVRSKSDEVNAIIPDYRKSVLDVYVDFVLHCCYQSESLDIICRPWAPTPSSTTFTSGQDREINYKMLRLPSWIASRDELPFGNPSWQLKRRLHGNPLVGNSQKRVYNTHFGSKPQVSVGRNENNGECEGFLYARGIVLGEISQTSTRLADAIITKECLEVLGMISRRSHSNAVNLPDATWRTLCADRDDKGLPALSSYRLAMLYLLDISSKPPKSKNSTDVLEHMSSIDIEELLDTEIPEFVKKYLMVVRDVIWNRRTFRSESENGAKEPLVGLVPRNAKIGDQVCILYGCSVPVVMRKLCATNDKCFWRLIGDAYVYGVMDGEAIRIASMQTLQAKEVEFKIN